MDKLLNNSLIGIVIGVRFRANFAVEDQLGKIVDDILYSTNSFFNSSVFPKVNAGVGTKYLINENTLNTLLIDNSNIILNVNISEDIAGEDLTKWTNHYNSDIIGHIMTKYNIQQIMRIGYVKRYLFKSIELANSLIKKTVGNTIQGDISDIKLSFTKRYSVDNAVANKNIEDFDNAIYNIIKKPGLDEIFMSVDFQRYFKPFLESAIKIKFDDFLNRAERFNSDVYFPWIQKNFVEG